MDGGGWWWVVVGGGGWRPQETTGDHSGQIPLTDFTHVGNLVLLRTPPGPLKLRLFKELFTYYQVCNIGVWKRRGGSACKRPEKVDRSCC